MFNCNMKDMMKKSSSVELDWFGMEDRGLKEEEFELTPQLSMNLLNQCCKRNATKGKSGCNFSL